MTAARGAAGELLAVAEREHDGQPMVRLTISADSPDSEPLAVVDMTLRQAHTFAVAVLTACNMSRR